MKRKASPKSTPHKEGLVIRPGRDAPLSRTQLEFNRLMKSLESTKVRHEREQARLDAALATAIRELMPLVEDLNRVDRDLILKGRKALESFNLSAQRRLWFGDLLVGKAHDLLADSVGLSDEDVREMEAIIEELSPPEDEEQQDEAENEDFNLMRAMVENAAHKAGLELDLSDLDADCGQAEFERVVRERLSAASAQFLEAAGSSTAKRARKPTKAQAAKERARLAQEEAKNRDLKSLFKQLAKAFHPDLEPDPLLKQHKQIWMQRLNTAYAANDLREMLQLEMEWLGEEATNLATAGDEKLKVYCMVLKEQITDLKRQIHQLPHEPQYGPLRRFMDPFYGTIASPVTLKRALQEGLRHHRSMLETLDSNNAASRRMIQEWTDEHACRSSYPF
ncbi:MAG: hypothetical protein RLZZ214_1838 [Verrucomicrobiota bacterium]